MVTQIARIIVSIYFSFYGYSRFASKEFTFITPLFVHMRSDTYGVKSNSYYLIPFFYYKEMHYIKEERADTYYKVWPIFKWHRDAEGNLFGIHSPCFLFVQLL